MIRWLRFLRDRRGVATIEFALLSSLFLLATLSSLDAGMFLIRRSQLSNALDTAALSSFMARSNVGFANLPTFVTQASRLANATVSVGCNGGAGNCVNSNRQCACLGKAGGYVAATCGATCAGNVTSGSTAGYYMTIRATSAYTPIVLPTGAFAGASTDQQITLRLQ